MFLNFKKLSIGIQWVPLKITTRLSLFLFGLLQEMIGLTESLMTIGLVPKKEKSSEELIITIVPMKIHYNRLDFLSKQSIFTKGIYLLF